MDDDDDDDDDDSTESTDTPMNTNPSEDGGHADNAINYSVGLISLNILLLIALYIVF